MQKIKKLKLKPAVKDKRRYLLIAEGDNKKIEKSILEYIGVLGFAKADYMKVRVGGKFSGKTVGAIQRGELENIRAALALGGIRVEKVGETLRGLGAK